MPTPFRQPEYDLGAPDVLLGTKIYVPQPHHNVVEREGPLSALSLRCRLTLVEAPAGAGKSTLLAQWVGMQPDDLCVAWLSVDAADNDPARFWAYVLSSVRDAVAPNEAAAETIPRHADILGEVLPNLLNHVATDAHDLVLVLDDYHALNNPTIDAQLAYLLEGMPSNMRVIIGTRSAPSVSLSRLRASGDLVEIRADELRFLESDAHTLLNNLLGLNLNGREVSLLCERTEGWVAGLYLAALSLRSVPDAGAFIKAFAGDNRHIADYFTEQVLHDQPPHVRDFLLRTAIVEHLTAPLCDALLQFKGSTGVLRIIEQANLFLIPLDSERRWFRYHHLFRELLLAELTQHHADEMSVLHRRAASWLGDHGFVSAAIQHFAATGDAELSADLVGEHWGSEFNQGRLATVTSWLDHIPDEVLNSDPRLCRARAWLALDGGAPKAAAPWIELSERHTDREGGQTDGETTLLRAVHSFKVGDIPAALEKALEVVDKDLGDAPLGRSAALSILGVSQYWSNQLATADKTLRLAADASQTVGNRLAYTYVHGYLACIALDRGNLLEAHELVSESFVDSGDSAVMKHFVSAMGLLVSAQLRKHAGDPVAADAEARRAVMLARKGAADIEIAHALLVHGSILSARGDSQSALRNVQDARISVLTTSGPSVWKALTLKHGDFGEQTEPAAQPVPLTVRELDLLRFMSTPLSYREIGVRMYVSLNTVKTHQRSLYRKLGVSSRADAVERGRELALPTSP